MKKGQALVEVMMGMGIAAALMPALITAFFASRGGTAQEAVRMQANARLREAREVLRLIKEDGWANIALSDTYHLTFSGGVWGIESNSSGPAETNLDALFTRQIVIGDAYRDPSGNFALVGTLDPSVKHIVITVGWTNPIASFVIADYYLMRFENLTWIQTTFADFTLGIQTGTAVTDTAGGEVILGSGGAGRADWCAPSLSEIDYDISGSANPNAISASVGVSGGSNQLIAGTGDSANGQALVHLSVSNTETPTVSVEGTLPDSTPRIKTNSVFVADGYGYITTDDNHKEVVILDLATHSETGFFNAPVNSDGVGVFVVGSLGFATVDNKLYTFDLSSKSGDRGAPLATITLSGIGARLVVNGSYVYVSESSGSRPLEIIEFSPDGKTLAVRGWATLPDQGGVDIVVNSTASRGYLATSQGNKVYILDTSPPYSGALPSPIGVYDTSGMTPKGVAVVSNNKAIVVGTGGTLQYQVIEIEDETNPTLCTRGGTTTGGLSIPAGVNGIASLQEEDGDTFSYIIIPTSPEIKIIQGGGGGDGGGLFASEGVFESSIFDAGSSIMFNRFDVTSTAPPPDTDISYQVAISNPVGSCEGASYSFIGPDKTSGTFFTGSSQLPLGTGTGYTNPGQCLKYRAYLNTSNTSSTPVLYDITFNYSP